MEEFPERIIRAVIPNDAPTPQYLLTRSGELPEQEHIYGVGRTFEGTLTHLGHLATGIGLSVDRCDNPRIPGEILYRTKPIAADTPLRDGHVWIDTLPI
jgi:hypothetical protein